MRFNVGRCSVLFILFVIVALLLPAVGARHVHIPLLAVVEGDALEGSIAHLYVDYDRGAGQVFIATVPLTKMDTQMSTRLAKRRACRFLDRECGGYDFYYTIRSDSAIIGGPSAGAAATVATVASLEGLDIRKKASITGTINSGNIIGSVGGLKQKIEAAAANDIDLVLIPKGDAHVEQRPVMQVPVRAPVNTTNRTGRNVTVPMNMTGNRTGNGTVIVPGAEENGTGPSSPEGNVTEGDDEVTDLIAYGNSLNVTVVEVATLEEALTYLTDKNYRRETKALEVSESYNETMQRLATLLCNRSYRMRTNIREQSDNMTPIEDADNLTGRARAALAAGQVYSAASFCFGANIGYREYLLELENMTPETFSDSYDDVERRIEVVKKQEANRSIKTITDLQTSMVVKERIGDASDTLDSIALNVTNSSGLPYYKLAYAQERLESALAWSQFYGTGEQEYLFDENALKSSCNELLAEADELYNYVGLYVPSQLLSSIRKEREKAHERRSEEEYSLCLFYASRLKAQSNVLLTAFGLTDPQLQDIVELKLDVAQNLINEQTQRGLFPIVGYSYYEYANSLIERDPYSSLLYAEYALELSDLGIYFETKTSPFPVFLTDDEMLLFSSGLLVGIGLTLGGVLFIIRRPQKRVGKSKRRKRKNPTKHS